MSLGPDLTQSGAHIGMHLNDIDREMTTFCRYARSVPICIEMDVNLPSLDQLRNNAAECIRLAEAARTSKHQVLFHRNGRDMAYACRARREDASKIDSL